MCASQKPLNNSHNIVKRPFLHLPSTGDQAVLHDIIKTGKIEMNRLEEYSAGELKNFCKECKIPYSGKSMVSIFKLSICVQD